MTSRVILQAPSGKQTIARALLDPGASISLITNRTVQKLQLEKNSQNLLISGIQGSNTGSSSHAVNVDLLHVHSKETALSLHALVVSKITCDLPLQGVTFVHQLPHLKDLTLADSTFDKPGRIDLLLGCNILHDVLSQEVR